MKMLRWTFSLILVLGSFAWSQTDDKQRIRATMGDGQEIVGIAMALSEHQLRIIKEGDRFPSSISLDDIIIIEVSQGVKTKASEFALSGFGIGLAVGFTLWQQRVAEAVDQANSDFQDFLSTLEEPGKYRYERKYSLGNALILGPFAGTMLGWFVGTSIKKENWKPVEKIQGLPLRVSFHSIERQPAIIATFRF